MYSCSTCSWSVLVQLLLRDVRQQNVCVVLWKNALSFVGFSKDDEDERFSHGRSFDYDGGFQTPYIQNPQATDGGVPTANGQQSPRGVAGANMAVPAGVWTTNPSMYTGPHPPPNFASYPPPGPYYGPPPGPYFGTLPGPQFVPSGPQYGGPAGPQYGGPPAHYMTNSTNQQSARHDKRSKQRRDHSPPHQGQGHSPRSFAPPSDQRNGYHHTQQQQQPKQDRQKSKL